MVHKKAAVTLWFDYLKLAYLGGLGIDRDRYAAWGDLDEVVGLSFNKWWLTTGRALFDADAKAVQTVELVSQSKDEIVVRIPLGVPLEEVRASVRDLVLASRTTYRLGSRGEFGFTGQINYDALAQYKRFLEIEFEWGDDTTTVAERIAELIRRYGKFHSTGIAQRKVWRKKGNLRLARQFQTRDPTHFGHAEAGLTAKRVSRWRLSGKHILLNVAAGEFPGQGYYGPKLKERLMKRLKPLGLTDIGTIPKRKAGRPRKAPPEG